MKIRHLILSGLAVVAMGFAAVGCNENPLDTPPADGAPKAPTSLQAVSTSETSVGLKWVPATDTGTVTFRVSWVSSDAADSGSVNGLSGTTSSQNVTGLVAGKTYTFKVVAVRGTLVSSAASVTWAGAKQFVTATFKMYAKQSQFGSGLVLDPGLGGPLNVSVANPPNPNSVQLAIYTKSETADSFSVGPAYAFVEYRNANAFDQNTYISDSSYLAQSLSTWYGTSALDTKIASNGNVRAFDFPASQNGGLGQGFYVRTGTLGNYHYARVLIKNVGSKLLQGTGKDRFVEVEISYQLTANTPYAKAGGNYSPANAVSTTGH